jgi:hypothetical protein
MAEEERLLSLSLHTQKRARLDKGKNGGKGKKKDEEAGMVVGLRRVRERAADAA